MTACNVGCQQTKDGNPYDKQLEFLTEPTAITASNEVNKRAPWTPLLNRYGYVHTRGGREVVRASRVNEEVNAVIECSWDPEVDAIDADYRIRVAGREYEIIYSDNEDLNNERMVFACKYTKT